MGIKLKEEEVKEIMVILSEAPAKYTLNVINFLSSKLKEHENEKQLLNKKEESEKELLIEKKGE